IALVMQACTLFLLPITTIRPGASVKITSTLQLTLACLFATVPTVYAEDTASPPYTFLDAIKAGHNLTSFRLRSEYVDQDNLPENAEALTLRSLIGWQTAPFKNFSFAAQLIDVGKLVDDYNDRALNVSQPGKANYPNVVDPDNTDINQLFVDWTGISNTRFRLGRQSVKLDNVRFIGNVEFRQVMQVFDGIAVENKSLPNTEIYLAHFDRVKQINTKLRSGDLDIANLKYRLSPSESLTGYGYFSNFNDLGYTVPSGLAATPAAAESVDASNKTLGLRLDGSHKFGTAWSGLYTAEYAKQDDYSGGDNRIDAHYYHLGAGAMVNSWYLRLDHETLSSNDSKYAFQTPFGTNHLFQGWADLFLVTPKQGIRDTYLSFGGKPFGSVTLLGEYHIIKSDEDFAKAGGGTGDTYGGELDLGVMYAWDKHLWFKAEYANFNEKDQLAAAAARKPDTEKVWLTVMYTF
ncbi:MAG TPA: alginate export family protein, partial [Methylophilaceae bacterium]|nr:alginate export family protein [Methylophilaceae bacterium]